MFRSIIMAIGVFLLILGGETLIVDRVVLADRQGAPSSGTTASAGTYGTASSSPFQNAGYQSYYGNSSPTGPVPRRVVQTKDWMPWSLLAAGTIVVLYSYSIGPIGRSEG